MVGQETGHGIESMKKRTEGFLGVVGVLFWLVLTGCGGNTAGDPQPPPAPTITGVSASPALANVEIGGTQQFTSTVTGTGNFDSTVSWFVNDTMSGNSTVGTIDISGKYTSPSAMPNPSTVTIKDCSLAAGYTNICGKASVTLTPPPPPPDKIAFTLSGAPGCTGTCDDIWVMNPDGSEPTQLTTNPAQDLEPAWSIDHTKIAFNTNRDNDEAIYVMNPDGSDQHRLQNGLVYSTWPAWSPDSTRIAFIGMFGTGDTREIGLAVMNADGSGVQQLTHLPCGQICKAPAHPSWSPDGKEVVFESPVDTAWQIIAFNLATGSSTNLSNNNFIEGPPSFSPNGDLISFSSNRNGGTEELFVVAADGSQVKQLTFGGNQKLDSTWSKDSTQIVFAALDDSGHPHLWKLGINDNLPPVQLVNGVSGSPSWH